MKYRIAPELASAIQSWLPRHMEPDPYGADGSAVYDVHSLYLDSADWSIYRDTRAGAYARFKLRARCYTFDPADPMFLEVKSRQGEAMWKTRARVSRATAADIFAGRAPEEWAGSPGLDAFLDQVDRRRAYPRAWVTYRRSAWLSKDGGNVRVTFDDRIRCAPPTADLSEPSRWWPLPEVEGLVVLELKYSGSYPSWTADLIRKYGLERRSMSKYRHAVDVLRGSATAAGAGERGEAAG